MKRSIAILALLLLVASPMTAADLEVRPSAAAVGSFGLDITLGSTCSSGDNVTLSSPPILDGDFEACRVLEVLTVEVGSDASFVAGESIGFVADFAVPAGASFSAVTDALMPGEYAAIVSEAPIAEQTFNARFHLRLDSLSLAEGEEIDNLQAIAGDGSVAFRLIVRRQAGQNLLVLAAQHGGGEILTPTGQEIVVPIGWNLVELDWRAGAGDGQLLMALNQSAFGGLSALDNPVTDVERFRWGAVDGSFSGSPGRLEVDGFSAWR